MVTLCAPKERFSYTPITLFSVSKSVVWGLLALPFFSYAQNTAAVKTPLQVLDSTYAVHGVLFGVAEGTVANLRPQFSGTGKRWKTSRVYGLLPEADTVTLASQPVHPAFWFRAGKFIGVTYQLKKEQKTRLVLQNLTRQYGPPKPGNVAGMWYWLGQRTYILYEDALPDVALHIASLGMLNEQVIETAVRQEARQRLGWQPDSLGLPRQFLLPGEKTKK